MGNVLNAFLLKMGLIFDQYKGLFILAAVFH